MAQIITKMAERADVAVSKENEELRTIQTYLNHFLWSSEIAYGYTLDVVGRTFLNQEIPANEAFAHLTSEAWDPTNQGRLKFVDTVGAFLDHVRSNTNHVYRAVIIFFASAFENYLDTRLKALKPHRRGS